MTLLDDSREPNRWERHHVTGWIATVSREPDGLYAANAHQSGVPEAHWATRGISDLSTAQQVADERVPAHEHATCPAWVASYPKQ